MAMKRCSKGHFYDTTKYSVCPFCGVQNLDVSKTMPMRGDVGSGASGLGVKSADLVTPSEKTVARGHSGVPDSEKTIGIMRNTIGFEPVVGWLVCIDGPDKGKDYRLKSEKNFIGRGSNMDVSIPSDNGISRSNHAIVSYSPKNNSYMLIPGDGHGLVYHNGEEVYTPISLKRFDLIEIGATKLLFVPFCGEEFQWQKN